MGWLVALGVLALLAILPVGVSILYDEDGARIRVCVGFLKFTVFPVKKKEKKETTKENKQGKSPKAKSDKPAEKKQGGPISDFFPFVSLVLDLLLDFKNALRFDRIDLKLVMAGGDPADLAINYGKAQTALGSLWPMLETWFVIKKRNVQIACDFVGSTTTVDARLDVTITVGRVICIVVRYGIRGIKEFLNFRKKRNGGTTV